MSENITKLTVNYLETPCYNILIGDDFSALPENLSLLECGTRRICIVSDSNVSPLYAKKLGNCIISSVTELTYFEFPAGEENKTLHTVQNLYTHLVEHSFDRKDVLIALGGGVTGDLTGFAAATYLRGIRFIQIPTTLLAMIDSSIGGKTGVDFDSYKNMVGAFYMPSLVYINLSLLKSLKDSDYCSGFGEMIKHSLIKDASYLLFLNQNREALLRRDITALQKAIEWSCKIKKSVVEQDPKETGDRALLNFGHTLGHAIEKVSGFSYLHGECVSMGMVAASYLSFKEGYLSLQEHLWLITFLQSFCLPVSTDRAELSQTLDAVGKDKKKDGAVLKFILLKRFGEAVIVNHITREAWKDALEQIIPLSERQHNE